MEELSELAGSMIEWVKANPMMMVLIVWVLLQVWNRSRPFPEVEGAKVRSIKSKEEFQSILEECKKKGSVVVVDYFATWCPPCRAAAPVFGEMSKLYDEGDVVFAKVNVDEARDVAAAHGIQAMPTFKIFSGEEKLLMDMQGWNESKLRDGIVKAINSK